MAKKKKYTKHETIMYLNNLLKAKNITQKQKKEIREEIARMY